MDSNHGSQYADLFALQQDTVDTLNVNFDASIGGNLSVGGTINFPGLGTGQLVGTDSDGALQTLTASSNTGCTLAVSGSTVFNDTPQGLAPSDSPAFNNLILSNNTTNSFLQFQTDIGLGNVSYTDGTGLVLNDGTVAGGGSLTIHKAVTTNKNTLDDGNGALTAVSITDSSLSALAGTLVSTTPTGLLSNTSISSSNSNGTDNSLVLSGNSVVLLSNMTQNLATNGTPQWVSETLTATSNQLILGTTKTTTINATAPATSSVVTLPAPGVASTFALINSPTAPANGVLLIGNGTHAMTPATLTGTPSNGIVVTNSSGGITLSPVQPIGAGNSPVFTGLTLSAVANAPLCTTGTGVLEPMAITNSNGVLSTFIGGTLGLSMTQNLATNGTPTFASLSLTEGLLMGCSMYQTGTVSQAGFGVTGSGTTFTSAMVGGIFISAGSPATTIISFASTTSITVAVAQTVTAGSSYVIYYNPLTTSGAFAVSQNGNVYHSVENTAGTPTTCEFWQLQNTGGGSTLAFDYQTYVADSGNAPNARMTVSDDSFGGDFRFWSRAQGADINTLQTNFTIGANRSITTANNTLDNGAGSMSVASNASVGGNQTCSKIIQAGINNVQITGLLGLPASPCTLTPSQLLTNLAFNNNTGAYALTFPTGASIVAFFLSEYGYTLPFNGTFTFRLVNSSSSAISLNAGTGNTFILPTGVFDISTNTQPANSCYTYSFLYAGSNVFFICGG